MQHNAKSHYRVNQRKNILGISLLYESWKHPIPGLMKTALMGDIVSFSMMGESMVQINHPALIRQVLIDNHKNYRKTKGYIRFEPVIGRGLFTSNGEKWKQDRQKIQPMFRREQLEGYYFTVISEVTEKYKQRWLTLADTGKTVNLTEEMVGLTVEIIVKLTCGKDNLDDETVRAIHYGYDVFTEYLKTLRIFPKVDLRKAFHMPSYVKCHQQYVKLEGIFSNLIAQHKKGAFSDQLNMLALLLEAQKSSPENFSDKDIMEHMFSMVFGGFETTSALMQWMYYTLDGRPDIEQNMREEIVAHAPGALKTDTSALTHEDVENLHYVSAVVKETMRMYPPIWLSAREAIAEDHFGDYRIAPETIVVLPHIIMHRHPDYWEKPNAFIPERFLPENEASIDEGTYFPFSHGPRKCIGYKLAEMEAKIIISKLLPFFDLAFLNAPPHVGVNPSITLKPKDPLFVRISRRTV